MVQKKNPEPADPDEDDIVLDLGDLTPAPKLVRINGTSYPMVNIDTLGLLPRAQLGEVIERMQAIEKKGAHVTAKEQQAYDARVTAAAEMILPTAPRGLIAKLNQGQRGHIVGTFLVETTVASPRLQMLRRLGGTKPSPDSNGSTAATP